MVDEERYKKLVKKHRKKIAAVKDYEELFARLGAEKAGSITLTSGRIVICPLESAEDESSFIEYYYRLPAGTYPVELARSATGRNALVRIVFSESPAVRYELALIGTDEEMDCISDLEAGRIPFYESCTASPILVADQGLMPDLLEHLRTNYSGQGKEQDYYEKEGKKLLLENSTCSEEPLCSGLIDFYLEADDAHFPIFFNGEGGGHHPIYWGFDKEENICCMIFDFDLKELQSGEVKPAKSGHFFMKRRRGDK